MQERTYEHLPADVLADLPRSDVQFDASIPEGQVDVYEWAEQDVHEWAERFDASIPEGTAFVRARRKARKVERRNRKAGRR